MVPRARKLAPGIRRRRLIAALGCAVVAIALLEALVGGGSLPAPPLPGLGQPARAGDPFAYGPGREDAFVTRASAGCAQVLYTKSPGGAVATAARVAAWRPQIDAAARGSLIDPNLLEGLVFVESAGRPQVIAGADAADAAGLTQILAQTGQSLLGMHIALARSRALTARIDVAAGHGDTAAVRRLERRRAAIDDRFDPGKALAGTVRYLTLARRRFGRADLAFVSYHMGIGNLQNVLDAYDGGGSVPYAQLYFDSAPDRHAGAWGLLAGFGDDSSLYYWRILGAVEIMHLYRTDRAALRRLSSLETGYPSTAEVLHPPGAEFADPAALSAAYVSRAVVPLPRNPGALGLSYDAGMGSLAKQLDVTPSLYRGLRPAALAMLVEISARVRVISGVDSPLHVASTVSDRRYESLLGFEDPAASTGYTFQIDRRYASGAQAAAFQFILDRLQALNVIAWIRGDRTIEVTVASDAAGVLEHGP